MNVFEMLTLRRSFHGALACLVPLLACALVPSAAAAAAAGSDYVFHVLPPLPGGRARASDINDQGIVVGSSSDAQGLQHAVTWRGGVIARLKEPAGESVANRLNRRGDIVGTSRDMRALEWRADGTVRILGTGRAFDINNRRAVAGSDGTRGVVLSNGVVLPLALLQGTSTAWADAFAGPGGVVGSCDEYHQTFGAHAAAWTAIGTAVELPGAGGESAAEGANARGQSVGIAWRTGNGAAYAARWDGTTAIFLPSFASGIAWDINNAGQAVGRISPVWVQQDNRASLWQPDTTWVDLNQYLPADLAAQGWVLDEAVAINEAGAIVGSMSLHGMTSAAFLLDRPAAPSWTSAAGAAADRALLAAPGVAAGWQPQRGRAAWH